MTRRFTEQALLPLDADIGFEDEAMRLALSAALEPGEIGVATYHVSAHIWVQGVLTDRALLLVKGAVRPKVTRVPFPLHVDRAPSSSRKGARVRTPLGRKTLWGSRLDPESRLLMARAGSTAPVAESREVPGDAAPGGQLRRSRRPRRPRPPRRRRPRRQWVGFAPPSTVWDLADRCVKCGRPLTNPRSRRARVGTRCIRVHGSQQRRVPNPAHAAWTAKKAKADVTFVAEKARADAEHARARAAYEEARAAYAEARAEWKRARG